VLPGTFRFNWKDGFYSPEKIENYKAADERRAMMKNNSGNNKKSSKNYGGKSYKGKSSYSKKRK
jgi:putative protease